jgi:Cys-tRNA(Pro)/Cys-tRNA(Cys) deacylase
MVMYTYITMPAATPAIAVLEHERVPYRLHEYEHDPRLGSFGLEAAQKLGLEPARVFKTLVVSVDGGYVFALIPVDRQLDLKAVGKRAVLARPGDAERITGYVKGGTSVLGGRKYLRTLLDESALAHETIVVNAGRRGLQVEVAPSELLRITRGTTAVLAAAASA